MAKIISCAFILLLLSEILEASDSSNRHYLKNSNVTNISDITNIRIDTTDNGSILGSQLKDSQEEIENLPHAIKTVAACHHSTLEAIKDSVWDASPYEHSGTNKKLTFKLVTKSPHCGSKTELQVISVENRTSKKDESIGFHSNGYFQLGRHYYGSDEYCVDKIEKTQIAVKYCVANCSETRPCVPKCYPPGSILGLPNKAKVSSGRVEYSPTWYKYYAANDSAVLYNDVDVRPHFIQHRPSKEFNCEGTMALASPYSEDIAKKLTSLHANNNQNTVVTSLRFRVQTDGRVFYERLDDFNCPTWRMLTHGKYCVDGVKYQDKEFSNREDEGILFACPVPEPKIAVSLAFGIVMIISSVFLLVTVVVYSLLWHQQNVHGWTIMAHAGSTFFAYIFLGTAHIIAEKFPTVIGTTVCYLNGVFTHFFFLSAFSWLSLISFDLWWTFRSIVPAKKGTGLRMILYLIIGWGIPGLIVLVSIYLNHHIGNKCTSLRLPKYGLKACYVIQYSLGVYIYYPIAVSLAFNLGFFCMTLFKLYSYKKNTNVVAKNPNQNQLLTLFAKLFFVVGVTWIFEFISWLHIETQVTWYWAVIDFINVLRAVALFVIYVCKQDIRDSLEKAYPQQCHHLFGRWRSVRATGGRSSAAQPSSANREADDYRDNTLTKASVVPVTP